MSHKPENHVDSEDMQAMSRVLQAEADSHKKIGAAQSRAVALAQAARADARRIADRADSRVQALHNSSRGRVQRQLTEMQTTAQSDDQAIARPYISSEISKAIQRLSRALIGQTDPEPDT